MHGHQISVGMAQVQDRVEHVATQTELREQQRYPWARIPTHDHRPTTRLTLSVLTGQTYRQSRWSDGRAGVLEDWLAQVMLEIEVRAHALQRQRLEDERKRQRARAEWETAMAQARVRYAQAHRAGVLADQLARWQRCRELSEYLLAMEKVVDTMPPGEDREHAEAWLGWAREHVGDADPLQGGLAMPAMPAARPEDLRPYLRGASPYGPP